MNTPEKSNRLQYRIDLVLTALFLAVIFFFGIMTVATDSTGVYNAARSLNRLLGYMDDPEDYSSWDLLAARVRSVDDYIASNIYGSEELGISIPAFSTPSARD